MTSTVGSVQGAAVRVVEILVILVGGTALVYATGGTKFVWPHVMYFAVVLAGVTFGRRAGVLAGIVAGLLMGPVMPLDVAGDVEQPVRGWLIRMGFYVAIGALAGYTRYRFSRLLDRRSSFLSSVSHEIRTPLSAVVGFAQILEKEWDGVSECEKREMAAHIVHESVEVAHVVDDLLVAARLDGGHLQINPEFVDVRNIADSILGSLPHDLSADRVRIHGSGHLWADPVRVRHMLRNLITNALIHGGGSAFVDVSSDDESVRITVTEDGGGISELMLPRLFEPFVATEASTMPQSVGLGLAVARELARRMGGRLTYRRDNGHGVFTWSYPPDLPPVRGRPNRHSPNTTPLHCWISKKLSVFVSSRSRIVAGPGTSFKSCPSFLRASTRTASPLESMKSRFAVSTTTTSEPPVPSKTSRTWSAAARSNSPLRVMRLTPASRERSIDRPPTCRVGFLPPRSRG